MYKLLDNVRRSNVFRVSTMFFNALTPVVYYGIQSLSPYQSLEMKNIETFESVTSICAALPTYDS